MKMAEALGLAASVIAVIDLSTKVASWCSEYYSNVKNAKDDIERLQREAQRLIATLEQVRSLCDGPNGAKIQASQNLSDGVKDCEIQLVQLKGKLKFRTKDKVMRHFGARALTWPFKSNEVDTIVQKLASCKDNISFALQVDQASKVLSIHQEVVLNKLRFVDNASFDTHAEEHNVGCYQGTRVHLLRQIHTWASDQGGECIFWLNGMAGTGKSTISYTVAKTFADKADLGASFFFKRGEGDRGHAGLVFTTIASQLVQKLPFLAPHIQTAIEADPVISKKSLKQQFETLVIEPLGKLPLNTQKVLRIVIVIDALDECDRVEDIRTIIRLLSQVKRITLVHLKFFLTSRPELPIRLGFEDINSKYEGLALHQIPKPIVQEDISIFLKHELAMIREDWNKLVHPTRRLPTDWPGQTNVQNLVQMAIPLFIFASTICLFIRDWRCGGPDEQLTKVFKYHTKSQESKLDATYLPVLDQLLIGLTSSQKDELVENFQEVVGSIVVLASPLSTVSLARLLDIFKARVDSTLDFLHSVLSIPSNPDTPVRLLHLSFRDFLLDSEKREKHPFWINEKDVHKKIATRCLQHLSTYLKKDICDIRTPEMPRADIDIQRVDTHLPLDIKYACQYWVHHIKEYRSTISDNDQVHNFLKYYFLQWLEALSLIGKISESIDQVDNLIAMLDPVLSIELSVLLYDAKRFLLSYLSIADSSPLQLYSAALIFAPKKSVIRNTFQSYIPDWISQQPKVELGWNANRQTLEGHSNVVHSVAFSHDSKLLASGSHDKTVRIWDAATGTLQQTLEGHSRGVYSVAFSHDSKLLASGSGDETVRIWDAATGTLQQTLEGHSRRVYSVAFSHDSKLLASGSDDETVRIWDAATGSSHQTITINNYISNLSFDITDSILITDIGRIQVDGTKTPSFSTSSQEAGDKSDFEGLGVSESWVTWNNQNLLWLPPSFRDVTSDISPTGSTLAVGCSSGKVIIIGFSLNVLRSYYS